MATLTQLLATGLLTWFALLVGLILLKILRGDIRTTGFLRHRGGARNSVDPERAVSMIAFPFVIGAYTVAALQADMTVFGASGRPTMPDVPEYLIMLLAGSNTLYLAGKIGRQS